MKGLFFSFMLAASLNSFGQQRGAVIMDPQVAPMQVADNAGQMLDASYINPAQTIRLTIPVTVNNNGSALPAGSCKIKIGLGSKLTIDPAYDVTSTALGSYFRWTSFNNGGQEELVGELISALPSTINGAMISLPVIGSVLGSSTITANFLITNHNTTTVLSDTNGSNNSAFIRYTVTTQAAPIPVVTINDLDRLANCSIKLLFSSTSEVNVTRYEVEASKDGVAYSKVAEVSATGQTSYTANFPVTTDIQSQSIFVRIKMVQRDGSFTYSVLKNVNGNCSEWELNVYPNPAMDTRFVTVNAIKGFFKGDYKVTLFDATGRQIRYKEISLNDVKNFRFDFGFIAPGSYFIKVANVNGSQLQILKLEKL